MGYEGEIKFRVPDHADLAARLAARGALPEAAVAKVALESGGAFEFKKIARALVAFHGGNGRVHKRLTESGTAQAPKQRE